MVTPSRSKSMAETAAAAASIASNISGSRISISADSGCSGSKRKLLRKGRKPTASSDTSNSNTANDDEPKKKLERTNIINKGSPSSRTSRFMAPTQSSSFRKKGTMDRSGHGSGQPQKPSSLSSLSSRSSSSPRRVRVVDRNNSGRSSIRALAKTALSPVEMLKQAQAGSSHLPSKFSPNSPSLSSSTSPTSPTSTKKTLTTTAAATLRPARQRPERQRHFTLDKLDSAISSSASPTKSKSVAGTSATIDDSTRKKLKDSWLKTIETKKKGLEVRVAAPRAFDDAPTTPTMTEKKKTTTIISTSKIIKKSSKKLESGITSSPSPTSPQKKKIRVRKSPSSSPSLTKPKLSADVKMIEKNDTSQAEKNSLRSLISSAEDLLSLKSNPPAKRVSDATASTESSDSSSEDSDMDIDLTPAKPSSMSKIWDTLAEAKQRQADLRSKRLMTSSTSFCTSMSKSDRQNAAEAYRKILVQKKKDDSSDSSRNGGAVVSDSSASRSSSSSARRLAPSGPPPRPSPTSPTKPSSTSRWTKKGSSWNTASVATSSSSRKNSMSSTLGKHLVSRALDVMDDDIKSTDSSSSSSINSNADPAAPAEANDINDEDDDMSISPDDFSWTKKSSRVIADSADTSATEDLSDSTSELLERTKPDPQKAVRMIDKPLRRGKRPGKSAGKDVEMATANDDNVSLSSCVSDLSINDITMLSKPSSILRNKDGKSLFGSRRSLNGSMNLSARFSLEKSQVIEVPRLYDDDDIQHLFYDDDELADMRHEAFCEKAGINPADFD